ncbi:hypothetical protein DPEC_G00363730 [Dallia pectoralis]|nr:hypothetical protein DPEC_G00363730 [Dallia pectoralis]
MGKRPDGDEESAWEQQCKMRHESIETFANIDGTAEEQLSLESEEPSRVSIQHESEETFVIIDDRTENPVSRYSATTTAVQVAEPFPCLDHRCQSEGSRKDPWACPS